ncbi:hypothetical protein B5E80_12795 [Flavonifractor sp. An135]|nr:hypothetical protein [Flavonifractor sp. An135]OUQ22769.1 hypothetical protein B5E80_12795 [Flavonifractor sp. An135]
MDKRIEDLAGALRMLRSAVHATELDRDIISIQLDLNGWQGDRVEILLNKPDLLGPDPRRVPVKDGSCCVLEQDLGGVTLIAYESRGESDPP